MKTELTTSYFTGEGRPFMEACIHLAAEWCVEHDIRTLVIFTGTGEGPHYAVRKALTGEKHRGLRVVAVSPPVGRPYRVNPSDPTSPLIRSGVSAPMRDELAALGVTTLAAHLPFKERYDGKDRTSEWARVAESFGILGGGFSLCVQAVLVACDAGAVEHGERVVALTADTALVARACRTESFLSPLEGLLVEHIVCRPARYDISKRFHETIAEPTPLENQEPVAIAAQPVPQQLPPGSGNQVADVPKVKARRAARPKARSKAKTTKQ